TGKRPRSIAARSGSPEACRTRRARRSSNDGLRVLPDGRERRGDQGDLERAELYRSVGDRRNEGNSLRWLSHILWCPGRTREARPAGWRAVDLLETLPPGRELAMAYANLASLYLAASRGADAAEWARRALDLARSVSAILRTLGARTRGEASAQAKEIGLLPQD